MKSIARGPRRPRRSCSRSFAPRMVGCCVLTGRGRRSCRLTSRTTRSRRTDSCGCTRATGEARWQREAQVLIDRMIADFEDKNEGGFFFTATDHEQLLRCAKDPFDRRYPAATASRSSTCSSLYRLTHQTAYLDRAGKALSAFGTAIARVPVALPMMLLGLSQYLDERPESGSKETGIATTKETAEAIVTAAIRANPGADAEGESRPAANLK